MQRKLFWWTSVINLLIVETAKSKSLISVLITQYKLSTLFWQRVNNFKILFFKTKILIRSVYNSTCFSYLSSRKSFQWLNISMLHSVRQNAWSQFKPVSPCLQSIRIIISRTSFFKLLGKLYPSFMDYLKPSLWCEYLKLGVSRKVLGKTQKLLGYLSALLNVILKIHYINLDPATGPVQMYQSKPTQETSKTQTRNNT